MPEEIKPLPSNFLSGLDKLSNAEMAGYITSHLIGEDVPENVIHQLVADTVSFEVPLIQLADRIWSLELFHGPTLAFKDFGARFLASVLG